MTLIEATRLAAGASGKAGGLLAQWAYPSSLVPLSFDLHQELANEHNGAATWGYRTIGCGKLTVRDQRLGAPQKPPPGANGNGEALSWARHLASWVPLGKRREVDKDRNNTTIASIPGDLDWFQRGSVTRYEDIAPQKETAQVHPYHFTMAMANLAEKKGVQIITGAPVEEIEYSEESEAGQDSDFEQPAPRAVKAVRYVDKATAQSIRIPADVIILAAGPWTPDLFPSVPMSALRAHSVTIKPTRKLSAYCLFTDISLPIAAPPSPPPEEKDDPYFEAEEQAPTVQVVSPEIYSRPNNEVYVAGESDTRVPLPASTDEVEVDRQACRLLEEAVAGVSEELRGGIVTGRRACYLPTVDVPSGNPLVGKTWVDGLLLATGHSCWGIHNAPATGKLISEILFDGEARSADISALDPRIVL